MENTCYKTETFIKVVKIHARSKTILDLATNQPIRPILLNLHFAFNTKSSEWLIDEQGNRLELVRRVPTEAFMKTVQANYYPVDQESTFDAIQTEFKEYWPFSNGSHIRSVYDIVRDQVDKGLSVSLENNEMDFYVKIVIENYTSTVVRATNSSIKGLEITTDVDCDFERSCSICFEEILKRDEEFLPCYSHPFHRACLRKWHKTCNYCPICRCDPHSMRKKIYYYLARFLHV